VQNNEARKEIDPVLLTNTEANALWRVSDDILKSSVKMQRKFTFNVSFNMGKLERHVKSVSLAIQKDEDYQEYEAKRLEITDKYTEEDSNGNDVLRKTTAHSREQMELRREYREVLDKHEEYMNEEHPYRLRPIKLSMVPRSLAGIVTRFMVDFLEDDLSEGEEGEDDDLKEQVNALEQIVTNLANEFAAFKQEEEEEEEDPKPKKRRRR